MIFRKRDDHLSLNRPPAPARRGGAVRNGVPGGGTIIGAGTRVRGSLKGDGPVVVRGIMLGEIEISGPLTVTATGRLDAVVEVESAELLGEARGSMRATGRVVLASTAVFEGKMATPVIELQPGSVLRGRASVAGTPPRRRRLLAR